MEKGLLEYNFRARSNSDEIRFGMNTKRDQVPWDVFSCPPKSRLDDGNFTIIKRPEIPEMEDFIERYMGQDNNVKVKQKKRVFLRKRL